MTLLRRIIASTLLAAALSCCSKSAKVTFHALGDDGKPIVGAKITVGVFDGWRSGEGFGQDIYRNETVWTNGTGEAVFQTTSKRGQMNYRVECGGYYDGAGSALASHESSFGKWQPWNPTVDIRLRRILHPIPLCARHVGSPGGDTTLPAFGQPVGFDLEISDWVAPYGKGKTADLIFQMDGVVKDPYESYKDVDGIMKDRPKPYNTILTLTFSNLADGIVVQPLDEFRKCVMRMPYLAPEKGYEPGLKRHQSATLSRVMDDRNPDENYFLRLRTQTDSEGRILRANYAKISGDFEWYPKGTIRFQYYFNPTPNDRNLEFAGQKSNLLKFPMLEGVYAP